MGVIFVPFFVLALSLDPSGLSAAIGPLPRGHQQVVRCARRSINSTKGNLLKEVRGGVGLLHEQLNALLLSVKNALAVGEDCCVMVPVNVCAA